MLYVQGNAVPIYEHHRAHTSTVDSSVDMRKLVVDCRRLGARETDHPRVSIVKLPLTMRNAGFDNTRLINRHAWWRVLVSVGAHYVGTHTENNGAFVWAGPELIIETAVDPLSGQYYIQWLSDANLVGHLGYVGVSGNNDVVEEFVKAVAANADGIKEYAPYWRPYI